MPPKKAAELADEPPLYLRWQGQGISTVWSFSPVIAVQIEIHSGKLIHELPYTAHSSSQHCPGIAWLT